jgi:TatD DNase family protein
LTAKKRSHRGERNEPAYMARTAEVVAQLKGLSVEELGRITGENARRFFGMG